MREAVVQALGEFSQRQPPRFGAALRCEMAGQQDRRRQPLWWDRLSTGFARTGSGPGVLQTGFINAFAIELRGIGRAHKRAVDVGNSTTPAKMKSAFITPRPEGRGRSLTLRSSVRRVHMLRQIKNVILSQRRRISRGALRAS
jgi:hypothetical protein